MANTGGTRTKRTPSAATIERRDRARGRAGFFQHLRAAVLLLLALVAACFIGHTNLIAIVAALFAANVVLGVIDLIAWKGWGDKK